MLTVGSLGADAPQGWKTPYVLVLLILGVVFIVAFLVWETKYPHAMIPMSIWKDRDFSLVCLLLLETSPYLSLHDNIDSNPLPSS